MLSGDSKQVYKSSFIIFSILQISHLPLMPSKNYQSKKCKQSAAITSDLLRPVASVTGPFDGFHLVCLVADAAEPQKIALPARA